MPPTDELQCQAGIWANFRAVCDACSWCSSAMAHTPSDPTTLWFAQELVGAHLVLPVFPRCRRAAVAPHRSRPRAGQPNQCAERLLPLAQRALAQVLTGGVRLPPPATGRPLTRSSVLRLVGRATPVATRAPLPHWPADASFRPV